MAALVLDACKSVPLPVALLLAGIGLFVLYGFRLVDRWRLRHIPGPRPAWLTGHLWDIIRYGNAGAYTAWGKQYGNVYKIFLGANPVVVINDAELGRTVNLRMATRHELKGPAALLVGEEANFNRAGLFSTSDRDLHRSLKAAWLPVFSTGSLDMAAGLMNVGAERLAAVLGKCAADRREINIWRQFGHMTMDVVGTAAFGVELRTQEGVGAENSEEARKLVWAAQTIFGLGGVETSRYVLPTVLVPGLEPLVKLLANVWPDKVMRQILEARRVLRSTVEGCIDEARRQQAEDAAPGGKAGEDSSRLAAVAAAAPQEGASQRRRGRAVEPGSFPHLLINSSHQDGRPFSNVEAASQAFTFLLAGYETTASALAFTVYCLSANPAKAAKLLQEVDEVTRGGAVGQDELSRMPYLEACLKEALRMYPPGVFTIRLATEDTVLGGYAVPKGTWVHVPVYTIQHQAALWPEPDAFLPERFIEGSPEHAARSQHPGAWMAFGDGTRVCVGQRFAVQEAKITLARLYQRFTFELSPGQVPLRLKSSFTLGPREGIFVRPVPRT